MSARVPSGTFTRTHHCGYTKTSRTQGLANRGLAMHSCQREKERQAIAARVQACKADTGTRRHCQCKRANHQHGTRQAYVIDRCRCRPCRDAVNAYRRQETKLKAYGRHDTGRVPIAPVQEHIQFLQDNGISVKRLAKLSGVSLSTLGAIKWGRTERSGQTYTRVHKTTADKILAVRPSAELMAAGRPIDATGTRRRLQALMCLGYSKQELGRRIDVAPSNMTALMKRDQVVAGTARKVTALYEQLWNKPAIGTEQRSRISVSRSISYARQHRYAPPLAGDDDTIDDPTASPAGLERAKQATKHEQRVEDLEHLLDAHLGYAEIMARLNVTLDTLRTSISRTGRPDLLTRLAEIHKPTRSAA